MDSLSHQSGIGLRQLTSLARTLGPVIALLALSMSVAVAGTKGYDQSESNRTVIVVFLDLASADSDSACDPQLRAAAQLVDRIGGAQNHVVPVAFNVGEPSHRQAALRQLDRFHTQMASVGQSVTCDTSRPAVIARSEGVALHRAYRAIMKCHTEGSDRIVPSVILIVGSDRFEAAPGRHPAAYFGRVLSGRPDQQVHFFGSTYGLGVIENPVVFTYPDLSDTSVSAAESNIRMTLYTWNHRLWLAFLGVVVSGSAMASIVTALRRCARRLRLSGIGNSIGGVRVQPTSPPRKSDRSARITG